MKIIEAKVEHAQLFADHITRLVGTSGKGDQPFFCPHDPQSFEYSHTENTRKSWSLAYSEPGWSRAWILIQSGIAVGHISVKCKPFQSTIHRCDLGMGLEKVAQNKGNAHRLLQTLFAAADCIPNLEYIDLQVFASNPRAVRLYERNGFEYLGRMPDAFRFGDQKIEDIYMVKKIK